MKNFFLGLLALGLMLLSGCKHDSDTLACPNDIVGTWQLVKRQCYCPAGSPVLNQRLVIENSGKFTFYLDGRPTSSGTYTLAPTSSGCGGPSSRPGVYFDAGGRPAGVGYTVADCQLTLDYGGPCDSPVDTYNRENN